MKISAIGIGLRSHSGVAARAFKALADKGINIRAITTSEIKVSMLIDEAYRRSRSGRCNALRARRQGVSGLVSAH